MELHHPPVFLRLQKEQAEADEKKRRKEAISVSHLRLGKVGGRSSEEITKDFGDIIW